MNKVMVMLPSVSLKLQMPLEHRFVPGQILYDCSVASKQAVEDVEWLTGYCRGAKQHELRSYSKFVVLRLVGHFNLSLRHF